MQILTAVVFLQVCSLIQAFNMKPNLKHSSWNSTIGEIISGQFKSSRCLNIYNDEISADVLWRFNSNLPVYNNVNNDTHCMNYLISFMDIKVLHNFLRDETFLKRNGKYVILTSDFKSVEIIRKIVEEEPFLDVLVYELKNEKIITVFQLGFIKGQYGLVNLKGRHLSVTAFQNLPYVVKDGDTWNGVEMRVIQELGEALNFSWTAHEPRDGSLWGEKLNNGHWTGLKGELARGETDIGIALLYLLKDYFSIFQVSYPYTTVCITFLIPKPKKLIGHWVALLKPLQLNAWIGYIMIAVFHIIAAYIISKNQSISNCIFDTIRTAALVSRPKLSTSSLSRQILQISWIIGCFFVALLYSSELSSWLVAQVSTPPIKTIEDFAKSNIKWGRMDTVVLSRLENSSSFELKEIAKKFQLENSEKQMEENILQGDYGILVHVLTDGYPSGAEYLSVEARSQLVALQECVASEHIGIGIRKGLPLARATSLILRRLQEAGLLQQWQANDVSKYGDHADYKGSASAENRHHHVPLTFGNLTGAFTLWSLGQVLSCIALCVEILFTRIIRNM